VWDQLLVCTEEQGAKNTPTKGRDFIGRQAARGGRSNSGLAGKRSSEDDGRGDPEGRRKQLRKLRLDRRRYEQSQKTWARMTLDRSRGGVAQASVMR